MPKPLPSPLKRGRLKLAIVLAVFLGPLGASFLWYYGFGAASAPRAAKNHAPLVQPAIPINAFSNLGLDGEAFTAVDLRGYWNLIHIIPAGCESACAAQIQTALYNTRQVRLALGRDGNRVQRIVILPNFGDTAQIAQLRAQHPDAVLLTVNPKPAADLAAQLRPNQFQPTDALVVDPLGNIMLRIPHALAPRLLLKDLKHLLRISRIG